MWRRLVVFIFITSLFYTSLFCKTTTKEADWVLAAHSFVIKDSSNNKTDSLKSVGSVLPSLILSNLVDSGVRILSPEEILQRKLILLNNEKTSLGNTLTSTIQERDKQLFISSSQRNFEKNIKEKDKKISETRVKLEEKDKEIQNVKKLLDDKDFNSIEEQRGKVVLWNNDPNSLFPSDRVKKEKVNGLLTGTITSSGNYLAVTVNLTIYPGEIHSLELQSLASVANISTMAQEIANQLKPVLQNRKTVQVTFDIRPAEAQENAKVYVDGEVFNLKQIQDKKILLSDGSHSIEVESKGFKSRKFTANFSDSKEFLAKINLDPIDYTTVSFSSTKLQEEQVYINGIPKGLVGQNMELDTGTAFGTIFPTPLPKLNPEDTQEEEVLQEGNSELSNPYYFVADIPPEAGLINLNLSLKRDTAQISTRIEKRRRAMYNSYSALLVSLIPSFVTHEMYINAHNALALGHGSKENAELWKNIFIGSAAVSGGLGLNLAIQLGLFLGAADSVLPEQAKTR